MDKTYQPVDAAVVPRFAGVATFMRLPLVAGPEGLDIALYGIPWDGGTTNRAGARHGPREVRSQSSLMRRVHHVSGTEPFSLARVADVGDVPVNPIDLADGLARIQAGVEAIVAAGALPLGIGGDHLTTLPVLRAVGRGRPVGLVHFDAHSDTNDTYFGNNPYTHGTPFRRAIEEGLIDPKRTIQIGIRGSIYEPGEHDWARQQGIRVLYMEEFCERGPADVMAEARRVVGPGPTYVSFDIDSIDPSMAPGTGTPEIGGFTTREAQQMVRLLDGLDIVGADVVEVSPPFDLGGMTALAGATMAFELLCVMARAVVRPDRSRSVAIAPKPASIKGLQQGPGGRGGCRPPVRGDPKKSRTASFFNGQAEMGCPTLSIAISLHPVLNEGGNVGWLSSADGR